MSFRMLRRRRDRTSFVFNEKLRKRFKKYEICHLILERWIERFDLREFLPHVLPDDVVVRETAQIVVDAISDLQAKIFKEI